MYSQLLGMSFDTAASPWITLTASRAGQKHLAGWGFAWYPRDDAAAMVIKDPRPAHDHRLTELIGDWARFLSTVFVCHIRGAAKRVTQQDTHPFLRSYAGRNFLFAHSGDLTGDFKTALPLGVFPVFEPLGRTDSEWVFCWFLARLRQTGARSLAGVPWGILQSWFRQVDALGTGNFLLSDGDDLVIYRDEEGYSDLFWTRRLPPFDETVLRSDAVEVDLSDPRDHSRTADIVSTTPLSSSGWTPFLPGQMMVVRRGAITWTSPELSPGVVGTGAGAPLVAASPPVQSHLQTGHLSDASALSGTTPAEAGSAQPCVRAAPAEPIVQIRLPPAPPDESVYDVVHETIYSYTEAVQQSAHMFRLRPAHDLEQELIDYRLEMTPEGPTRSYDDVFGNHLTLAELRTPYTELNIRASSRVRVRRPPEIRTYTERSTLPLVWMPWQRQMMVPYLLPLELPATQLRELSDFATSFAERQDYDLIETLLDVNRTIYRDFRYIPGSTSLETTPFDVYVSRQGVCQDFANLFICLARLLDVPARYRVGYIFTGGDYENKIQSEASHAWAELYLPYIGWRGFDPTNGCLAELNHVRVASGRNYRDATPTSGTIYRGGVGESLVVSVRMNPADAEVTPGPAPVDGPSPDFVPPLGSV